MPDQLSQLWKFAPVVALLVLVLWAGHKGWWYWSAGVRAIIRQLEHERDEWRSMALMLLEKEGINLPPGFTAQPTSILSLLKNGKEKK
jgi:hypothetical protein